MHINTDIDAVRVEIEGREYDVAPKTIAVAEQLIAAQAKNMGRAQYHLWRAELEILLGKSAVRELFAGGQSENLDRMELIHAGVVAAFGHNSAALRENAQNQAADVIANSLAPVNELLRRLQSLDKAEKNSMPVVRR